MSSRYLPFFVGLSIVVFITTIYYTSARFAPSPDIILPDENYTEPVNTIYENRYIYQDTEITSSNFKTIIDKLHKPTNYSFTVTSTIYAYDTSKTTIKNIQVTDTDYIVSDSSISFFKNENELFISQGEQTKSIDSNIYTADEAIGIPTYKDLLLLETVDQVTFIPSSAEDFLEIIVVEDTTKSIFLVSLSTGLLSSYQIYENDILKRDVSITNLQLK